MTEPLDLKVVSPTKDNLHRYISYFGNRFSVTTLSLHQAAINRDLFRHLQEIGWAGSIETLEVEGWFEVDDDAVYHDGDSSLSSEFAFRSPPWRNLRLLTFQLNPTSSFAVSSGLGNASVDLRLTHLPNLKELYLTGVVENLRCFSIVSQSLEVLEIWGETAHRKTSDRLGDRIVCPNLKRFASPLINLSSLDIGSSVFDLRKVEELTIG
ncbi:hypothetical protein HK102_008881, partial [Quaeritorhiza haematococci]